MKYYNDPSGKFMGSTEKRVKMTSNSLFGY